MALKYREIEQHEAQFLQDIKQLDALIVGEIRDGKGEPFYDAAEVQRYIAKILNIFLLILGYNKLLREGFGLKTNDTADLLKLDQKITEIRKQLNSVISLLQTRPLQAQQVLTHGRVLFDIEQLCDAAESELQMLQHRAFVPADQRKASNL